jgi:L-aminopeptidase/D-esterase-like protein
MSPLLCTICLTKQIVPIYRIAIVDKDGLQRVGIKLGHYTDEENLTGLTCFIAESGANIGIDVRGSNSGTMNTPLFDAKGGRDLAHAVVFAGGSLFGLESTFGVMQFLEEAGIGYSHRGQIIPLITGAVIYDLLVGNSKVRPTKANGFSAAQSASQLVLEQGNIGVGTGATVGKWTLGAPMKGGFGMAISTIGDDILVAAFVVTNAIGDVVNPKTGQFYSESGQYGQILEGFQPRAGRLSGLISLAPTNTTLAVVATNIALEKTHLMKVAEQAHNGMARSIQPIHTNMDGDVVFALSSLSGERKKLPAATSVTTVDLVSLAAAEAMTRAIKNSIIHARSIPGFPALAQKE